MNFKEILALGAIYVFLCCNTVSAHDGRRLDVTVIDNKLFAQGYLSGTSPIDDGGGVVRPYFNSIHSHFRNVGPQVAIADLPGFDLRVANAPELVGHDLVATLLGAGRWESPPPQDGTGLAQDFGTPVLTQLAAGNEISVGLGSGQVSTTSPGSLTLASNITGDVLDIDLDYVSNFQPVGEIHFLQWQLSTSQPSVAPSDPVFTILSPDGIGPVERLHFQSLALERSLGVQAVPEPGTLTISMLALLIANFRRRKLG